MVVFWWVLYEHRNQNSKEICPKSCRKKTDVFSLGLIPWIRQQFVSWFPGEISSGISHSLTLRCGCLPQWCNVWSCVWKMPFWRVALHHPMLLGHVLSNSWMAWEYEILSLPNVIWSMVVSASNTMNGSQEWDAGDYCDDDYWWKDSLLPIFILDHFSHWTPIRKWRSRWPHLLLSRLFLSI